MTNNVCFPIVFLPLWRTCRHFHQIKIVVSKLLAWKSLKFVIWERFNPLPDSADFK